MSFVQRFHIKIRNIKTLVTKLNALFHVSFSTFCCRAVGCIFGELLNNSPLFAVSVLHTHVAKHALQWVIFIKTRFQETLFTVHATSQFSDKDIV